jgi:hypothetical protein
VSDEVEDEIAQLRAEIKIRADRIEELSKLRSYPSVTPVQVFWRYHSERREEYDWSSDHDQVRAAYKSLEYGADEGQCSPVGVEVGGSLITMDELRARYGRDDD